MKSRFPVRSLIHPTRQAVSFPVSRQFVITCGRCLSETGRAPFSGTARRSLNPRVSPELDAAEIHVSSASASSSSPILSQARSTWTTSSSSQARLELLQRMDPRGTDEHEYPRVSSSPSLSVSKLECFPSRHTFRDFPRGLWAVAVTRVQGGDVDDARSPFQRRGRAGRSFALQQLVERGDVGLCHL